MKLLKLRNLAMMGVMGVGGLGLIGAGAHAVFTTSSVSKQTITAGTPQVVLSSADAANGCTTIAIAEANPGTCSGTLSLTSPAPVGSTFETPASQVWVTNTGNVPVTETSIQMGATAGNSAGNNLLDQMSVCLHSWDLSYGPAYAGPGWVEANVPLSAAIARTPTVVENPVVIAPGASIWYSMDFYAGQDSACGSIYSSGPSTSAFYTGELGAYTTPASLSNNAEGGIVTPTFTYNYSA
jgi:hypothetical protein